MPKISVAILVAVVLYGALIWGEPRMADGALSGEEMLWYEKVLVCLPAPSILAVWVLGLWRANRAGSWPWFLAQLLLLLPAYVYTLFVNTGEGPNNAFNRTPLRGAG